MYEEPLLGLTSRPHGDHGFRKDRSPGPGLLPPSFLGLALLSPAQRHCYEAKFGIPFTSSSSWCTRRCGARSGRARLPFRQRFNQTARPGRILATLGWGPKRYLLGCLDGVRRVHRGTVSSERHGNQDATWQCLWPICPGLPVPFCQDLASLCRA